MLSLSLSLSSSRRLLFVAVAGLLFGGCGGDNTSMGKRGQKPGNTVEDAGVDANTPDAGVAPRPDASEERDVSSPPQPDVEEGECEFEVPLPAGGDSAACDELDAEGLSVFVATYGDDSNDGSMSRPLRSIQAGIDAAAADDDKRWVLIESGTYNEALELANGVHLVGGYAFNWEYGKQAPSKVRSPESPGVVGRGLSDRTRLVGLDISLDYQAEEAESVITVYLERSSGVRLEQVEIAGASAGNGAAGSSGSEGSRGGRGSNGGDGVKDSSWVTCDTNPRPSVGSGGTSSCGGPAGGAGGMPGHHKDSGQSGKPSSDGKPGGAGGEGKQNGAPGTTGGTGTDGAAGQGGTDAGHFQQMNWVGAMGKPGVRGGSGHGGSGGGGGGGGGYGANFNCKSWGGAGGGGGSGGCGGTGGTGGKPGGASVALFLDNSAGVKFEGSTIVGGRGGQGGRGGEGGNGGAGGTGGIGGGTANSSGRGGTGGSGGAGGKGGSGGGGAGGPAFCIFSTHELANPPGSGAMRTGVGGSGGSSSGNSGRGATGQARGLVVAE